jgi:glucoamylase
MNLAMRPFRGYAPTLTTGLFLLVVTALPLRADDLDDWAALQSSRSKTFLEANISPKFAALGAVVAAPSFQHPQYFSYWVRDGAVTMDVVVTWFEQAQTDAERARYETLLDQYQAFSRQNQKTPNPSGDADGAGLGEPRFNADGTVYSKWGRPQNDGAALRALTLMRWANWLLDHNQTDYVRNNLYDGQLPSQTVIKNDLEFVGHHMLEPCVDIWEERPGKHFYTRMVQREALLEGAKLATRLGDSGAATFYQKQQQALQTEIEKHKDSVNHRLIPTLDDPRPFDAAVILAVLHTDNSDDNYLGAADEYVLGTADTYLTSFAYNTTDLQDRFEINNRKQDNLGEPMGLAVGRYSEDKYDGDDARARSDDGSAGAGNPWILCTLAVAELEYRAAHRIAKQASLVVTENNLHFLQGLDPSLGGLSAGTTLTSAQPAFQTIVQSLMKLGDAELRRVRYHANPDGSLYEQMNRRTGFMWGAPNLSWSHAALLTAVQKRTAP